MSSGLDNLIRGVVENIEYRIRRQYDELEARGVRSPIEKYFAIALTEGSLIGASVGSTFSPLVWAKQSIDDQPLVHGQICLWAQERVLDWPADFVLGTLDRSGRPRFAIVECDGHDFHERTKEQAERDRSRDRRVQELGWRMFRFTGRELHRNATAAAMDEVLARWAIPLWVGDQ